MIKFLAEAAVELKDENIEILTTDSPMDGAYLLGASEGRSKAESCSKAPGKCRGLLNRDKGCECKP